MTTSFRRAHGFGIESGCVNVAGGPVIDVVLACWQADVSVGWMGVNPSGTRQSATNPHDICSTTHMSPFPQYTGTTST